jgi:hypothetical protein
MAGMHGLSRPGIPAPIYRPEWIMDLVHGSPGRFTEGFSFAGKVIRLASMRGPEMVPFSIPFRW